MPGMMLQAPQQQAAPQTAGPIAPQDSMDNVQASYDKLRSGQAMLGKVRNGLDGLMKLGDTVSTEDVVKAAGNLVAAGLTPEGMATLLAEMPEKSEQLQEWIAQHDQDVNKRMADIDKMTDQYRHQLGVEGMQRLLANGGQPSAQDTTGQDQATPQTPDAGSMGL